MSVEHCYKIVYGFPVDDPRELDFLENFSEDERDEFLDDYCIYRNAWCETSAIIGIRLASLREGMLTPLTDIAAILADKTKSPQIEEFKQKLPQKYVDECRPYAVSITY